MKRSKVKTTKSTTNYKEFCDRCPRKAEWSFRGRDGKVHGACKRHLKVIK